MALLSVGEVKSDPRFRKFSEGQTKSAAAILEEEEQQVRDSANYDVFLSHSYADADLILALKTFLEGFRLSIYVDWVADRALTRSNVTRSTAATLRRRMSQCRSLLFATTPNARASVWMPWELGYFDGRQGLAGIVPLTAQKKPGNSFDGQEYLGLYPYVVRENDSNGTDTLWVHQDLRTYMSLHAWLRGEGRWMVAREA